MKRRSSIVLVIVATILVLQLTYLPNAKKEAENTNFMRVPGELFCESFNQGLREGQSNDPDLEMKIKEINSVQEMRNPGIFKEGRNNIIALIQVHDRLEYLSQMIRSLTRVKGIETETVLVFSHDAYDSKIFSCCLRLRAYVKPNQSA
ncbi:hypothetical protein ACOME3_007766 [Neoechinorhynchus agilis]